MPLTKTEAAYVAGLIDGEGSISLVRSHAKRTRGRYVYPTIRIANTDEAMILWLQEHVPGCSRYVGGTEKPVWHLTWACQRGIDLLYETLPFLITKRARAHLVIETWETREQARADAGGYFGNGHPLPDWLVEQQEVAFDQLARMNRRGR